jgi:hypothetical protein
MRKMIIALSVLAMVMIVGCRIVEAVETCMPVKVVQVSPDHDGSAVVVVVNQDGDSFMFSDIKWKAKVGQKMFMCISLTYTKGNFWTMDERGDMEPFLSDKPTKKYEE